MAFFTIIGFVYPVTETPEMAAYRQNLAEDARSGLIEKRLYAIGECGTSRFTICFYPLIDNLKDANPKVRTESARALGKLNLKEAADALNKLFEKEKEKSVRYAALWSLGYVGNEKSGEVLAGMLSDEDPEVRRLSAFSLSNLAPENSLEAINGKVDSEKNDITKAHLLRASLRIKITQPDKIKSLVDLLNSKDSWARYHVANTIGELGIRSARLPLQRSAKIEEVPATRKAMNRALAYIRMK